MICVRAFAPGDEDAFRYLFRAYLTHYGMDEEPGGMDRMIEHLIAGRHMSCHLAWDGDTPAGFTTWNLAFPARSGLSLVMKELFVTPDARGTGLGRALLAALAREASDLGCVRLDWATDGDNPGAQAFYASLGLKPTGKISYRVDDSELVDFANRIGGNKPD